MRRRFFALRFLAALVCLGLMPTSRAASDHTHLTVVVEVPADEISGEGDAMGVYAVQLQPCSSSLGLIKSAAPEDATQSRSQRVVERLLSAIVGTAYANHRDRFDGPAASEFRMRVALDRPGNTSLGELIVPSARYCGVVLTLARLPAVNGLPALENSLRLSASGAAPLEIAFRESIALSFSKPWVANGAAEQLKISLRPRAVQPLLARQTEDFGTLSQRVMTRLTQASSVTLSLK